MFVRIFLFFVRFLQQSSLFSENVHPFVAWVLCCIVVKGAATRVLVNSTGGQDTASCGSIDVPCLTLQHGIDMAKCGDAVLATGFFSGPGNTHLSFPVGTENVTLLGSPSGAQIFCPFVSYAFLFTLEGRSWQIANLRLTNCAIAILGDAILTAVDVEFVDFVNLTYSLVTARDYAVVLFSKCIFKDNSVFGADVLSISGNASMNFEDCRWANIFVGYGTVIRVDRPPSCSGS